MKIKILVALLCGTMLIGGQASAQKAAVKTNLLYWATTTPNLALEFGLGKRTTLEVGGTYNPFTFKDNAKFKHWMVQPEFRLWNCQRFNRGFWGIHLMGGEFNVGNIDLPFKLIPALKTHRYEGWAVGGGVSYGYDWYLSPRWNMEATIGVGYLYLDMKRYECAKCGDFLGKETKNYFGPTKFGLSFSYLF